MTTPSAAPGLTTMGQTVVVGPPDAANGGYSTLQAGAGEPHLPRSDISAEAGPASDRPGRYCVRVRALGAWPRKLPQSISRSPPG